MTGLVAAPSGTLADRALDLLATGPQTAESLAASVFGMPRTPPVIADRIAVALLGPDPRVRRLPDGRWSLVARAAGSPLVEDAAFAVVDVETTGGQARGRDRITEVAVVVVQGSRCEVVYDSLINPERPIPAPVVGVTGITDAMVRAAPTFDTVVDDLLAALAGRIFVAHNVGFDWGFLSAEVRRVKSYGLHSDRLCTVRLARALVPGLPSYGLDSMADYFGFENPARHRAGGDALVTGRVLQRLLELARGKEVRTVADLERLRAGRRRRRGKKRRSAPEDMI